MADFKLRAFCRNCGYMKRTMPFNDPHWHTGDGGPCAECGDDTSGLQVVAREVNVGKWWRPKFVWFDRDGNPVRANQPSGGDAE